MFREENKNYSKYCETLESGLMLFAADVFGESSSLQFQQDGAAIHQSQESMSWMREREISILVWPTNSPDICAIENV